MVYHIKSRSILNIAKKIFGNIVISAYIESTDKKDLNILSRKYSKLKEVDILEFDADTIILMFNNGNNVRFTNSEWVSISKCEKLNCN